jgi:predicted GIY-YIG superfamily endonuclease
MIELLNDQGPWAVYLLHFAQPVNGQRHYVGITTCDRLGARMIEHTTGRGAKLTAAACRAGTAWRLAHVWRTADAGLEGELITRREARQLCPVCRRISTGVGYSPTKKGDATKRPLFGRFTLSQANSFPNEPGSPLTLPLENDP